MIQYVHDRKWYDCTIFDGSMSHILPKGGTTIALDVFEPWLFDQLVEGDTIEKRVGIARCSDEDNYHKAIGRELAASRLKLRKLKVTAKYEKILALSDDEGNLYTIKKRESGKVHFVEFNG